MKTSKSLIDCQAEFIRTEYKVHSKELERALSLFGLYKYLVVTFAIMDYLFFSVNNKQLKEQHEHSVFYYS